MARLLPILKMMKRKYCSSGFTLVELIMTFSILVTTIAFLLGGIMSFNQVNDDTVNQTNALLTSKSMVETLQQETFSEIFSLYNGDPNDDPGGPGTAPGEDFDVTGLQAFSKDIDGKVGKVRFPTKFEGGVLQLREDPDDSDLAMDLNGNGIIDVGVNITDYKVLPVKIEIRWQDTDLKDRIYELTAILRE